MSKDVFIQFVLSAIIIEVLWSAFLFFFRLSSGIPSVLVGLIVMQGLAIYYIDTAPKYAPVPSADLGGANLGPVFVGGFITLISALLWMCCFIVSVYLIVKKMRKKKPV